MDNWEKLCIVTGAGRGIGAAIARVFAREGATVVVTDKVADLASSVAGDIGAHHMRLNVASEADWAALTEAWPTCDVLVNMPGSPVLRRPSARMTPSTPHGRICGPCMRSTWMAFLGCRYAIGAMRTKGAGSIINISSRSGLVGIPAAAACASSKAAVRNHTKSVALY